MSEDWRSVVGWEGLYEVSALGRVRSTPRTYINARGRRRDVPGRILTPTRNVDGYARITLSGQGNRQYVHVHTLVADAFLGERTGDVVRHLDGDPTNNALSNLAYGTFADNEADKASHGRAYVGERNCKAKLGRQDIPEIFRLAASGMRQRDIAGRFGVSQKVVWSVLNRRTWSHVAVDALALTAVVRHIGGAP